MLVAPAKPSPRNGTDLPGPLNSGPGGFVRCRDPPAVFEGRVDVSLLEIGKVREDLVAGLARCQLADHGRYRNAQTRECTAGRPSASD